MATVPPVVLTIAGTDPSGGAGIQADLRVFQALHVAGAAVITAALAQNSSGVNAIHPLPPRFVGLQIDSVTSDVTVSAVKIGMLENERIVTVVAERITRRELRNVIVDPVLAAKDGRALITPRGVKRMVAALFPKALVVTPNVPEAAVLAGMPVLSIGDAREAARRISDTGPRYVMVKGGHWGENEAPTDLLFDGNDFTFLEGKRLPGVSVRGTGCMLSSAIAAYLALGHDVPSAAREAKAFVANAIGDAAAIGKGHPVWPGFSAGNA